MHEFAVWAPHAETVSLRLFTQDADPMAEHRMTSGDDGWWHVTAEAADGDEYVFNVAAGGEQWERIDPRGVEVTSSVGRSIVRSSEQGEMPFTARPVCEWVVYELHPGTFGGDLDGVGGHLDHLVELGVNAVVTGSTVFASTPPSTSATRAATAAPMGISPTVGR